jgi:hypothetical protein
VTVEFVGCPLLVFYRLPVKNVGWPGSTGSVKVAAAGLTIKPSSGDAGAATPSFASVKRFAPYSGRLHEDRFVGALLLVFTRLLETLHRR